MKEIARRQNEPKPLKIQFASRMLFNRAEVENYIVWMLYFVSAIAGFVGNGSATWIAATVIIVSDLLALTLEKRMERDILQAADMRSMFDRYVFGMPQLLTDEASDELCEVAEDLAIRYPEEYRIQTTHTGSDTPPGVKDWYNTNIDIPTHTAPAFSLIKENKWWDRKMVRSKNIAYTAATLIIVIPAVVLGHNMPLTDIIVILAGILGLLIRLGGRILTMYQYQRMSIQLDGFVEKYDNFAPDKGLDVLQNAIEERRRLPIVHCNAIHTKLAKKLHEKYEAIHTKRIN